MGAKLQEGWDDLVFERICKLTAAQRMEFCARAPRILAGAVLRAIAPYVLALLSAVATAPVSLALFPYFEGAVFLLVVMLIASWFGRGPALLASLVNAGAFIFLFVPPQFSPAIEAAYDAALITVVLLAAALITPRLRRR